MPKRILVVDDEKDIREIIKIALSDAGFEVVEAGDGKTAIEMAKSQKPDLITMDIIMPNLDGFEAAKIIKENPETKNIPIIILSVMAQDKDKYIQGITDYISKPFRTDELVIKIRQTIEKMGVATQLKNILVVDDDPDVIDIISLSLKDRDFIITGASNGVEALEKLKICIPNIIIADINMPRMDGFELIKNLKKEPKYANIPIIVLTGTHISKDDESRGITLGATKYLTKPFTIDALVKDIEDSVCH
jgi:CheY-like chemotaxis protein